MFRSLAFWVHLNTETNYKKNKIKQVAFSKSLLCVFSMGWSCPRVKCCALNWWKTETHPEKVRPNFPFSCSLSSYLLGECLISGQTVFLRNYGVFSVHKDIVPNVFSPSNIYNHFLLLNSRLIWILTICQFQHTSPINISFLGREEAQMMWSCVVL